MTVTVDGDPTLAANYATIFIAAVSPAHNWIDRWAEALLIRLAQSRSPASFQPTLCHLVANSNTHIAFGRDTRLLVTIAQRIIEILGHQAHFAHNPGLESQLRHLVSPDFVQSMEYRKCSKWWAFFICSFPSRHL